jgi:ABC-type Fe3+-hydroxamate transport system substrate-binding protein
VYSKVQEIDENSGDEDMILDLVKLNHVGKENPDQLTAIGFGMKKVEEASTVAEAMQQLLAEADGTTPQYNEARKVKFSVKSPQRGITITISENRRAIM